MFLLPVDENGERKRATISDHVNTISQDQVSREDQLRFKLKIDGDQLDDHISYNQLMEYLEDNTDTGQLDNGLYKFKCIKDHRGPYTSSVPEYLGSSYNLHIEQETGEMTWEALSNIIANDPYPCAIYAKKHDLLNTLGWKLLKRHARTARRVIRTLKSQSTDKLRHQENINMGGKFQETMHMPYSLIFKMAIINGRMLLTWKLHKSRNTKNPKIMERLVMRKIRLVMLPRDIKRSEYILSLMSNTAANSKQDLSQMDILPRNLMKLSTQELFL